LFAGLAMALGPLTAMTIASVENGTAGSYVAAGPSTEAADLYAQVGEKRLADVAASSGSLEFFSTLATAAEVKELLRGPGQFTVFMPVNEAFSEIGGAGLSSILGDPTRVQQLAKAHIVEGRISAIDLLAGMQLRSINGSTIASSVDPELRVNGATIIGSEVADNGMVYYVDRLL
jgi:uncharacterized surface protein with fasciclin (FAS1) repeats